ncbi:MAG TPA: hypothetical protein VGM11_05510 [Acidobacteriaceae bacterium]
MSSACTVQPLAGNSGLNSVGYFMLHVNGDVGANFYVLGMRNE